MDGAKTVRATFAGGIAADASEDEEGQESGQVLFTPLKAY